MVAYLKVLCCGVCCLGNLAWMLNNQYEIVWIANDFLSFTLL